jgi:ribonuclease D
LSVHASDHRADRWSTDPGALDARIDALVATATAAAPAMVGLDTEFMRERTYWPQLALVQIAFAEDEIWLIDPLTPGMAPPLARLLGDARILKLMHSASEDLLALRRYCDTVPQPLFDTQIAAALGGIGAGLGYQKLVQTLLGVTVDKGETRSDWLRRPLSEAQLRYAADDVAHLAALHVALAERLAQLGRSQWLVEDCARLTANAQNEQAERWPHLATRAAQFLDRAGQLRLLRLLRWRDGYAREHDRPRNWVLDNELALTLARTPPIDAMALQRVLDSEPKAPRRLGEALWRALSTPLADEAEAPEPRQDDRDRHGMKRLQQAVAKRSAELGLPDGVLASRRWLEALQDGEDWPGALAGWRRSQLEAALAPVLAGAGQIATGDD